jgi:hypothetical protein
MAITLAPLFFTSFRPTIVSRVSPDWLTKNLALLSMAGFEQAKLLPTSTAVSVTFANNRQYLFLHNKGASTAYIDFETDATTNSYPLLPGARVEFPGIISKVSAICSAGQSSDVRVVGIGNSSASPTLKVYKATITGGANASIALQANTIGIIAQNNGGSLVYLNLDAIATTDCYDIAGFDSMSFGISTGITTAQFCADAGVNTTVSVIGATGW